MRRSPSSPDPAGPVLSIAAAVLCVVLVNLPFGYWRAGVRKFSPAWFLAVHAPVPIVVLIRHAAGLEFRWATLPVFVAAFFAGQSLGARWRRSMSRG